MLLLAQPLGSSGLLHPSRLLSFFRTHRRNGPTWASPCPPSLFSPPPPRARWKSHLCQPIYHLRPHGNMKKQALLPG